MFFFVLVHFINLFFIMFLHYRPFYLQRGRQLSRFNREWFSQQYKLLYRLPWRKLTVHAINFLLKDRKSTRLNSSHVSISYAVFCLKKKNNRHTTRESPRTPST